MITQRRPPYKAPPAKTIAQLVLELPRPPWFHEREKHCLNCPHLVKKDELHCGLLMSSTKAGMIYHEKGLPNPDAQCPDVPPRWLRVPRQSGKDPAGHGCGSGNAQMGLSSAPSATTAKKGR